MKPGNVPVNIASIALVAAGVGLLALNIFTGGRIKIALPLLFLVLGGAFFIITAILRRRLPWADFFYILAALLSAFGFIFLLNELTGDWNAWAYAWLFLLAALGAGMILANQERNWHPSLDIVGWSLVAGGITLFILFGAIAGGQFIQVMAPVLLAAAGLALRWLYLKRLLPDGLLRKMTGPHRVQHEITAAQPPEPLEALTEPLSSRELEVLNLIDAGLSNQQIASRLNIAPSTVKTHINNIYGKLGVQTRVQAVNQARLRNLLDP